MKHTPTQHAFTLIELMIAIALGTMVVYVATAGLRTAAQSVSLAQNLATENSIIRAGMNIALAETDFWSSHDNPYDSSPGNPATPNDETVLRNYVDVNGRIQGMSFTPMKVSNDFNNGSTVGQITGGSVDKLQSRLSNGERNRLKKSKRWDPNAWMAHDPRSWSWVNLAERVPTKSIRKLDANGQPVRNNNGKVERESATSFKSNCVLKRQLFGAYYLFNTLGTNGQPWHHHQINHLKWTLGSYGMLDYIPSNTPLAAYSNGAKTQRPMWLMSPEWCYTGGGMRGKHYYLGADGGANGVHYANDILGITLGPVYSMANPYKITKTASESLEPRNVKDLIDVCSKKYWSHIRAGAAGSGEAQLDKMIDEVDTRRHWLDTTNAPEIWPQLHVSSIRHIRTGQFLCLHRITWVNNLTGKETEFSFTAFGTTLRGARQQRHLKENKWANPFPQDGDADPHLDSYDNPLIDNGL